MKKLRTSLLFLITLLITNCNTDENNISNPLIETGLIGEWEIIGRGINNVSSLEVLCCETLSFSDDDNKRDLNGSFVFEEHGVVTNGSYTVNLEENTINYAAENSDTISLGFVINNFTLEVWYFDDNNRNWTTYIKK